MARATPRKSSRALETRRRDVNLVTKCRVKAPPPGQLGPVRDSSRANILHELDQSLQRLRTDWVDVLLVHWPDAGTLEAGRSGSRIASAPTGDRKTAEGAGLTEFRVGSARLKRPPTRRDAPAPVPLALPCPSAHHLGMHRAVGATS